jgi:diguanylate cyclase (GGDEF)-like protein
VQELMEHPPKVPDGLLNANSIVSYTFEGVEKRAVWMELSNGMRLNVAAPVREINGLWTSWVRGSLLVFLSLLALCILFTMHFTKRITEPLRRLTEAAREVDAGNYDVQLEYDGKDEIGSLTRTFRDVTSHLKDYINGLNDLAYADALTSLHNKGAFDIYLQSMQSKLNEPGGELEFAICIFDCNNLKQVNDQNGHDKGDVYIKQTVAIICEVFDHSPVFRIGGDEFAAIVLNEDFRSREALLRLFDEKCAEKRTHEADVWEQVDVARGMAVYDPAEDASISDVVRRADKLMYENKWLRKRPQAPDGARKEPL